MGLGLYSLFIRLPVYVNRLHTLLPAVHPLIRLVIICLQVYIFSGILAVFCTHNSLYAQLLFYVLSLFLSSTLDLLSVLILDQNINEIVLT